jgi:demethylmenaquinone methyltransferase/2-methoxy-6-polyprenyl-1,4-benzoquinol methylase
MSDDSALPAVVVDAGRRAGGAGFSLSSESDVGALLSCLAAGVARGGRILELGTGAGSGLAWLVHGLGHRVDVEVVTVDIDQLLQAQTRDAGWPSYVHFELGDGASLMAALGPFDLIFADAPGGKTVGLDGTIGALRPGGTLVVDDMALDRHEDEALRRSLTHVRRHLVDDERLVCAELSFSSGVIVAVRRWDTPGG